MFVYPALYVSTKSFTSNFSCLSKFKAMYTYINEVDKLKSNLLNLIDEWKDEIDPRVPSKDAWVPEEQREDVCKFTEQKKRVRR